MAIGIRYAYRGEANSSWSLRPTLRRVQPTASSEKLLQIEREALQEFRAQAHLYIGAEHLPTYRDALIEWWPLMQHYGAATRLLDWTYSPFVAAYFAVDRLVERDGVVYVVDAPAIQERLMDRHHRLVDGKYVAEWPDLFRADAPDEVFFWMDIRRHTARSVAQQGIFTVSENVASDHGKLFDVIGTYAYHPKVAPAARWIILASAKDAVLKNLRTANIAAHSLFPGRDGLGRSVSEVARIGPKTTFSDTMRSTLDATKSGQS